MLELPASIQTIMEILPHRYPFLLIDRVLEYEAGRRVKALKNVTSNEPFFNGHFPGQPVMPGVLIIEAMAQAGGILAYLAAQEEGRKDIMYLMGLDKVKFRRMVVPGDQIIFEVETTHRSSRAWKMAGKAFVDGNPAAQAELMATFQAA